MSIKVSFDVDGTLIDWGNAKRMHSLIKTLLLGGADVWVLTTRKEENNNVDLFKLIAELNIPRHKIIFTNGVMKVNEFVRGGFDLHIDDDWVEVAKINENNGFALLCDMTVSNLVEEFEFSKQVLDNL